jgi:hypothetical protein
MRAGWRTTTAAAVAVALVAIGCGGDGGASAPPPPTTEEADIETDPARLADAADAAAAELEAAVVERTGLDATAVDEVVDATASAFDAVLADVRAQVETAPIQGFRPIAPAQAPGVSSTSGLFTGSTAAQIAVLMVLQISNGGQTIAAGGQSAGLTVDVSRGRVAIEMDLRQTSGSVTSGTHVKAELAPCPDANGDVEGRIDVTVDLTQSMGGGGSVGSGTAVTARLRGHADDDARLDGYEVDGEVTVGDTATARGGGQSETTGSSLTATFGVGVGLSGGDPTITRVSPFEVTSSSGSADDAYAARTEELSRSVLMLIAQQVMRAAEEAWQSGRCIRLEPTVSDGPTGLDPGAAVDVTAAPRSRIDGSEVGGTVSATLASGESSVEPSGRVRADADFVYTAPDEEREQGTVTFESRSRRGVGRATVAFDTNRRAWLVAGDIEGVAVDGTKCGGDTGDWHLHMSGAVQGVSFRGELVATIGEDRSGPVAGAYTYTGSALSGSSDVSGTARLALAEDGAGGTLTLEALQATTSGTAGGRGFSDSDSVGPYTFTVTPAPADAC